MHASVVIDADTLAHFMSLGDAERASLARFEIVLEQALEPAVTQLYSDVRGFPPAIGHFVSDAHLERARAAQVEHWRLLIRGDPERQYAVRAKRIGAVHARIGLDHRIYMSGYAVVLDALIRALHGAQTPAADIEHTLAVGRASGALVKLAMLDMGMVISAYLDATEAQSASKARFLASLAQDLRTPLNAVIGHAELALEEFTDRHEATRDINQVLAAAYRLLRLINGLLDLAKIEAGATSLAHETFDVGEFVRHAIEDVAADAANMGDVIGFEVDAACGEITTDPDRLGQILSILLGNAVRFTRDGEIVVRVRCETLRGIDSVVFEIADTGPGFSPEQIARFFGEGSGEVAPSRGSGSGLGLMLAQGIARRLGGALTVESERDKGATFLLTLPAEPAPESS